VRKASKTIRSFTTADQATGHPRASKTHSSDGSLVDPRMLNAVMQAGRSFGWQRLEQSTGGIITDSGHWVMEEQREQTTAAIVKFIDKN
jgi:pimeloyl-ACP methyl ester carboxylesterase